MTLPERLGKYRVTGVIGEGAMGTVYRGHDPGIDRVVALKTIRRGLADSADGDTSTGATLSARFRNEAQAGGRLSHPGIVGVYDYGDEGDIAYIAMEFVEGASLARYLSRDVKFVEEDIVSLVGQLLDALDHAHARGVWHRDIKPANLILTKDGRLKVADFGIARIETANLTQVTSVLGTPGYMAPEQFLGKALDRRVDLYAAGVVLYQLLVGSPPFSGSPESLMYRVVHEPPVLPSALPESRVSAAYDGILAVALSKNPAQRFDSAAAFKQALTAVAGKPLPSRISGDTIVSVQETPAPETPPGRRAPLTASHWDPAVLSHVESQLARHIGPLAAVMVRRAARDCADLPSLYRRLAEQVTSPQARNAFVAQVMPHGSGGAKPETGGGATTQVPVTDALIAQTTKLLARHVGPIAPLLAKRAAAKNPGRDSYFLALEEQVPDRAARAELRKELAKLT